MKNLHEFRIVITPFCNYRCFFCHGEGLAEEFTPLLLSPDDYGFIASVGKKYWGWNSTTITGGEPLISPIFRETCRAIADEGVKVTVVTNASLLASPKKILADVSQVNVSLHSMDPITYKRITGTPYPLDQVIDAIVTTRAQLPDIKIHLNVTVVRDKNDSEEEFERIIKFAHQIRGQAKFIDLASKNPSLVVSTDEIRDTLERLGFAKADENAWQTIMARGDEQVTITKCGFAQANAGAPLRNVFLNPDGSLSVDRTDVPITKVLHEIHERDAEGVAQKVEWLFPEARQSRRGV